MGWTIRGRQLGTKTELGHPGCLDRPSSIMSRPRWQGRSRSESAVAIRLASAADPRGVSDYVCNRHPWAGRACPSKTTPPADGAMGQEASLGGGDDDDTGDDNERLLKLDTPGRRRSCG
jgi:hypothetical protein